jgi:hypothetical protein
MEHFCGVINPYKMLSSISWSVFLLFLVFALAAYYTYVGLVYFRKEMVFLFRRNSGQENLSSALPSVDQSDTSKPIMVPEQIPETSKKKEYEQYQVYDLISEIKDLLLKAAKEKMIRQELIQSLKSTIRSYGTLGDPDLKEDISQHILMECQDQCGIVLTETELSDLWKM